MQNRRRSAGSSGNDDVSRLYAGVLCVGTWGDRAILKRMGDGGGVKGAAG